MSTGNRMVFPYTPSIIIQHNSNYGSVTPVHNNYPFFAYQNSSVEALNITGQMYVQNSLEAQYWVGHPNPKRYAKSYCHNSCNNNKSHRFHHVIPHTHVSYKKE